jgi:hypothetical protein
VAKLSADGETLQYSSYLGGSGDDAGNGIAADASGNAYVAGETNSRNFPTTFQPGRFGSNEAFVTKFNPGGTIVYSVRLGGSKYDCAEAVAVDGNGCAYVTGYTYSGTGFPLTNVLQNPGLSPSRASEGDKKGSGANKGGGSQTYTDAFVTKLNFTGNALLYSVLLGGSNDDNAYGIAVDRYGCAYVSGGTRSADFVPSLTSLIGNGGGREAFVVKLNQSGTAAVFAASLAGNSDEEGFAIALDGSGHSYLTGYTYSTDIATAGVLQPYLNNPGGTSSSSNGSYDGFVAKISDDTTAP